MIKSLGFGFEILDSYGYNKFKVLKSLYLHTPEQNIVLRHENLKKNQFLILTNLFN